MAVAALRELGVHMPASPSKFHVIAAVLRTKLALAFTDLSGLAALLRRATRGSAPAPR
jgi:hypothetical protein